MMVKKVVQKPVAASGKTTTLKTTKKEGRLTQTNLNKWLQFNSVTPTKPKSDGTKKKMVSSGFISSPVNGIVEKSVDKSKSREKAIEEPLVVVIEEPIIVTTPEKMQSPMQLKADQPKPPLIDLTADSQELSPQESQGSELPKSSTQIGEDQKVQEPSVDDDVVVIVDDAPEDPIGACSPLLSAWDHVLQPAFQSRKVESPVRACFAEETSTKLVKDAVAALSLDDKLEPAKMLDKPLGMNSPGPSIASTSRDATGSSPRKPKMDLPKIIMPPQCRTPEKCKRKRTTTIKNPVLSPNDSIFNESFNVLKRKDKPVGEVVVRNHDERRKLQGHDCPCCVKYYDALNLTPESRAKRINEVSRHRKTYEPYKRVKTPEHFWEMDFPDTPELLRRGYLKQNF